MQERNDALGLTPNLDQKSSSGEESTTSLGRAPAGNYTHGSNHVFFSGWKCFNSGFNFWIYLGFSLSVRYQLAGQEEDALLPVGAHSVQRLSQEISDGQICRKGYSSLFITDKPRRLFWFSPVFLLLTSCLLIHLDTGKEFSTGKFHPCRAVVLAQARTAAEGFILFFWFCECNVNWQLTAKCGESCWCSSRVRCGGSGGTWMENLLNPRNAPVVLPLFWNEHRPSCLR